MKRLLALTGWIAAGIGWTVAAVAWRSLPTQADWDARYREGVADGQDRDAQESGA